ncbi:hypothetical protein QQF64_011841, partial [Cirrhinus molitorella]
MQESSAGYGQKQVASGIVCSSSFIHMRETQSFTHFSLGSCAEVCVNARVSSGST